MHRRPYALIAAFLSTTSVAYATAQSAPAQSAPGPCLAPPAVLKSTQPNIFSEQQEQWLGDAMADLIESQYKPARDPAQNAYLGRIANRLLAALPPTTIQFRVLLVDSSEVNGFSLAGGRVYITRKLVANTRNEDEVASVIAHEMGHILSHQFAIETTADLKRLLGVTSVTDKADIYAKFQRLIDARMKDKHPGPSSDDDDKQNQADAVAVYATAAAGYRPQAYSEFWDRMFFVDGKVGGALSDFFGVTKPESKRLRAMLKLINALPPGCGATQITDSPEFDKWRNLVVANQRAAVDLDVKPVAEVALTPPLRMDLERLRFSRDGKYILAQDESSIFVLSRDPYQALFRFDAEKALPAEFSPDSQRIVFHTPGLHTEEWSVPERKMLATHEPVARNECLQSKLSPDGRTLFCISYRWDDLTAQLDLTLLDPVSGGVLFQKKDLFDPSLNFMMRLARSQNAAVPQDIMPSSFSPDGNFLLIGPGNGKLAFDLRTRALIPLGENLKLVVNGAYAFLGNDKIVGINLDNVKDSGVFSFPDGRRLQNVPFGFADLQSVTNGNFVLSHSITDYAIGLADLSAAKFVAASKAPAMDVWNGWLVNENADGTVLLHKMGEKNADQPAPLPLSPLGPTLFAVVSNDRKLLALSTRTRAGVWDLATGQQVLLSRRFNSATFAPDNTLYAELPKFGTHDRGIVHFSFNPMNGAAVPYKEDDTMRLYAGKLLEWKPINKKSVELIVHNPSDNSILWRRTFDAGEPPHAPNILPGQTLLSFPLKNDFAKARLKADSTLASESAAVKIRDNGRLIQVLDDATGKVLREMVFEATANYEGVEGINVVGDALYLSSADNRTLVYNLADGTQLRQLFGYVIAGDPATGRICTVNRRDEAVVYDSAGHELTTFHMGNPLRFATFQSSSQLLLLTSDQKVRTMQIPPSAPAQSLAASF